jgi:hypothetical protein
VLPGVATGNQPAADPGPLELLVAQRLSDLSEPFGKRDLAATEPQRDPALWRRAMLARFTDAPEPALREQVANALLNKGVRLGALGRSENAVAVYDELLARFTDAPEPTIGQLVEMARKCAQTLNAERTQIQRSIMRYLMYSYL